jgi:hypothetical protein
VSVDYGRPDPTTERKGVNAVESIFLNEFDWLFREQPVSDHGIDAQVEVIEFGKPTGKLIALQIKTGQSYFRKRGENYVFYGEQRHLDYWTNHSLPVFLILHDPGRNLTIWQKIERRLVEVTTKGWSIVVPASNVLSIGSKEFFSAGIASDEQSIRRFNLAVDFATMKRLASKDEVYFEIEHWVNKSLSMRGVNVMFDEYGKDEPDVEIDLLCPVRDYHELMARYFAWLDYEHEETQETATQEIDIHVLRVWLNDLGKSYIALEEYFANGRPVREEPELSLDYDGDPPDW